MVGLQTKAVECEYKENNRLMTEQFICGLNDNGRSGVILREVATLQDIEDTMNECVDMSTWTRGTESNLQDLMT